jgi:fatty-acyl-CoA synthase
LVSGYASNCPEYLDLFFAAGKIGAVLHNLNWRLTAHELGEVVADAEPRVLFYGPEWSPQVERLRPVLESTREIVALGEPSPGDWSLSERERESAEIRELPDLGLDHPWGIYYTGGTTGLPKVGRSFRPRRGPAATVLPRWRPQHLHGASGARRGHDDSLP